MNVQIIKASQHQTNHWSGGTTTQLFIHPKEADFKERNFNFRLSKAIVSDEVSVFTSLSNVHRILMVLEGIIELVHEQHHSKTLSKFEVDNFLGDWKTTCYGSCSDFNLMLMNDTKGNVKGLELKTGETLNYKLNNDNPFYFFYLDKGKATITLTNETNNLEKGDLLIAKKPMCDTLQIKSLEDSVLISVKITNLNTLS